MDMALMKSRRNLDLQNYLDVVLVLLAFGKFTYLV